ncbi:hypothetical protein [Neogemmobacter tilapiae]|uniref:Uncharacterized protein n=1 Tax=Neogemmobacter tilapiae TaxID=875041 RepID=A0A918TF34_9RHOB|nr:hypothetical protein [Gemmobacter tilapiae]GHC44857.1 hypothetical protein GCM10007315_02670 [Gemmobacter tilapiae]
MKDWLGGFDFLWDLPKAMLPENLGLVRTALNLVWQIALVGVLAYVAVTQIYYEYFLWVVER